MPEASTAHNLQQHSALPLLFRPADGSTPANFLQFASDDDSWCAESNFQAEAPIQVAETFSIILKTAHMLTHQWQGAMTNHAQSRGICSLYPASPCAACLLFDTFLRFVPSVQVYDAFETGMMQSVDAAKSSQTAVAAALQESLGQAQALAGTLSHDLQEGQRHLVSLASQAASREQPTYPCTMRSEKVTEALAKRM